MKLKLLKTIKRRRGFSIVGSLLGFALLGISTAGLTTYMGKFEQIKENYSESMSSHFYSDWLLGSMRDVLLATHIKAAAAAPFFTELSKKTEGVCSLVQNANSYSDVTGKADGEFYKFVVNKSDLGGGSSLSIGSDDRWKYFLEKREGLWKASSNCKSSHGFSGSSFTKGPYKRCYKLDGQDKYALLEIIPVSAVNFSGVSAAKIQVDELAFRLKVKVSTKVSLPGGSSRWSSSFGDQTIFMTEVDGCSVCNSSSPPQCVLAQFSSSGFGSSLKERRVVYHSPYSGQAVDICSALSIGYVAKNVVQAGAQNSSASGVFLQSDTGSNVAMSCTSHLFKCKNDTANRFNDENFDPAFQLNFGLNLDKVKGSNIDEIGLTLKKSGASDITPGTRIKSHSDAGRDYLGQSGGNVKDYSVSTAEDWPLQPGGSGYTLYANSSSNTCKKICSSPGSYYPKLTIKWNKKTDSQKACSKDFSLSSSAKIACTVCYMKTCHRFGVGTFGPVQTVSRITNSGLKDEPLDGNVPECALGDTTEPNLSTDVKVGSGDLGTGNFLKIDNSGELVVSAENESEKTACFINGKYSLVKPQYGSIAMKTRERACFRASYQTMKAGNQETNGLLASMGVAYNTLPAGENSETGVKEMLEAQNMTASEGEYKFFNSAAQGIFISPLNKLSSDVKDALVNYQTDSSGMVGGGWLSMPKDVLEEPGSGSSFGAEKFKWAFFYREPFQSVSYSNYNSVASPPSNFGTRLRAARPIFIRLPFGSSNLDFPHGVPASSSIQNSDARLLLTHHIQYKGLRKVNKTQSSRSYPFLCRKKNFSGKVKDQFVLVDEKCGGSTIKGRNFENGYKCCRDAGYLFLPPDTPELWISALHAVAPTAPRYPFPNPFNFADGIPRTTRSLASSGKVNYGLSFAYSSTDYNKGANTDDLLIVNSSTTVQKRGSTDTLKVLGAVRSAWVGLVPVIPGNAGEKKMSDWRVDLGKVTGHANIKSHANAGESSIYAVPAGSNASIQAIYNFAANTTQNADAVGLLDRWGVPLQRSKLRTSNNLNTFAGKLVRGCRFNAAEKSVNYYKAPFFRGKSSAWPSSCSDNTSTPVGSTSRSIYHERSSKPAGVSNYNNLTDMGHSDISGLLKGVRTAYPFYKNIEGQRQLVLSGSLFCDAWNKEKIRREATACIISKFNSEAIAATRTCRTNLNTTKCNAHTITPFNKTQCDTGCDTRWTYTRSKSCEHLRAAHSNVRKVGNSCKSSSSTYVDRECPSDKPFLSESICYPIREPVSWNFCSTDPVPAGGCTQGSRTMWVNIEGGEVTRCCRWRYRGSAAPALCPSGTTADGDRCRSTSDVDVGTPAYPSCNSGYTGSGNRCKHTANISTCKDNCTYKKQCNDSLRTNFASQCKTGLNRTLTRVNNSFTLNKTVFGQSCSSLITVNYNSHSGANSPCKSIDKHKPYVTVTHGGNSGNVGLFADGENLNSWTKNSPCLSAGVKNLAAIPTSCGGNISLGSSLDSDLCTEVSATSCSSLTYNNFPWDD